VSGKGGKKWVRGWRRAHAKIRLKKRRANTAGDAKKKE